MCARAGLQLCEEVAHVRLHRLLGEEESHADLAGSRLLLELLQGPAEGDDLCAPSAAALRHRVKTAAVVHVSGQDLFALSSVHRNRDIGLPTLAL